MHFKFEPKIQTEPNLRSLCVYEREGSSMRYLRRRALTTLSTSQNTDVKSEIREPQTLGWRRQETNAEFWRKWKKSWKRTKQLNRNLQMSSTLTFKEGKNRPNDFVYEMKRFC